MNSQSDGHNRATTLDAPSQNAQGSSAYMGWDDGTAEVSGFKKWRAAIFAGVTLAGVIGFAAHALSKKSGVPAPEPKWMCVLGPGNPPPTPEPVQPTPTPVPQIKDVLIPREPDPQKTDPEPPTMPTTSIFDRNSTSGIGYNPNPTAFVPHHRIGQPGHADWNEYAAKVNARIAQALEGDSRTRKLNTEIVVRVWPNSTGRITRVEFERATGNGKTDAIIRDEILTGLQIAQPPPEGMPAFIRMKVIARRPN